MSTRPIFDCLLCCDEKIVMKKLSHDSLSRLTGFQFKPFIGQLHRIADMSITPLNQEAVTPIPKIKHWSYLRRKENTVRESKAEPERSLFRKEVVQVKITYEEEPHDIYNPYYSSEEEVNDDLSFSFSEEDVRGFNRPDFRKQARKQKKKMTKKKSPIQNFAKVLAKKSRN